MPPPGGGQSVTHPLGIRCYLTLRKDSSRFARATARQAVKASVPHLPSSREDPTGEGCLDEAREAGEVGPPSPDPGAAFANSPQRPDCGFCVPHIELVR